MLQRPSYRRARTHYRLALAVAILFLWNLGFHIYPYAQSVANPTLEIATDSRSHGLPALSCIGCPCRDNRTIQYFNPQVKWKELWERAWIGDIEQTMDAAYATGKRLWFDLAALERFNAEDQEFSAWLKTKCQLVPDVNSRMGTTRSDCATDTEKRAVMLGKPKT